MNKFIIIFAFVALLKPVFPFVEYMVNYDYISKVLCENKAKPELKCNGKCHLMKEMAKAAEEEKPLQDNKKNLHYELETLFIEELPDFGIVASYVSIYHRISTNYSNLYFLQKTKAVFHPPTV